jgi:hypothetical protein
MSTRVRFVGGGALRHGVELLCIYDRRPGFSTRILERVNRPGKPRTMVIEIKYRRPK